MEQFPVESITLSTVRTDDRLKMRAQLDQNAVDDYTVRLADGVDLPPVVVFRDAAGNNWLAGGYHRLAAHKKRKLKGIKAEVRPGEFRDAILFACGENAAHGVRRTNEDKRLAVQALLEDEEWEKWTDSELARAANVSQPFVSAMRKKTAEEAPQPTKRTGRDGKQYKSGAVKTPKATKPAATTAGLPLSQAAPQRVTLEQVLDFIAHASPEELSSISKAIGGQNRLINDAVGRLMERSDVTTKEPVLT